MRNPEITIRKLRDFADKIERRYYQPNFLFSWGYYEFLVDLGVEAKRIHEACKAQLTEWQGSDESRNRND